MQLLIKIMCLIILLLEMRGMSLSLADRNWKKLLIFYTQLSNLITMVSVILLLIFGELSWIKVLRYLSTCMLILTFLVTVFVLVPMGGNAKKLLWSGHGLYFHILCPVSSVLSYIMIEEHKGIVWLPVAVTMVYGVVLLYLNWFRIIDGPYPFFRINNQSAASRILWMLVLVAVMTAISAGVNMIAG